MPQPSEIRRPDNGSTSETEVSSAPPYQEVDPEEKLSFLSIISLALNCNKPQITIPRMLGIDGRSYGLGAGVSSTVARHQSGVESVAVCPPGTMIALKRFNSKPDNIHEIKRLHQLLLQELQIFCHPYLRSHANICQMLYVGWEETKLFPIIALEMGTYGTLSSALQQIRSHDSTFTKSYLTVDIILGLEVLHACGFYHGDIKTDNIIIQTHPDRQVIAKLADFSGAKSASTCNQNSRPDFGTHAWQPPEVLLNEAHIDWKLADIYSLGMVIATLWTRTGFIPQGGTFFDTQLTYDLDVDTKNLWMRTRKVKDDMNTESVINSALSVTNTSERQPLSVHSIISHTLSRCPQDRYTAKDVLLQDVTPFQPDAPSWVHNDITTNEPTLMKKIIELDKLYEQNTTNEGNVASISSCTFLFTTLIAEKVDSVEFLNRPGAFCRLVQQTMIKEATDMLKNTQFPELQDLETEYLGGDEEAMLALDNLYRDHKRQISKSGLPARFQHLAYEIFLSYTAGHHTKVDEIEAIKWLYWAAMAQNNFAMLFYCSFEASFPRLSCIGPAPPKLLWSAKAALQGHKWSENRLKNTSPVLQGQIESASRKLYWGRKMKQTHKFTMSWSEIKVWVQSDESYVNAILPVHPNKQDNQETALHYATAVGDIEFVKYLVTKAGADVNVLNCKNESALLYATITGQLEMAKLLFSHGADVTQTNIYGVGVVHALTQFNDVDAAAFLPDLLHRGIDICSPSLDRITEANDSEDDIPAVSSELPLFIASLWQYLHLFDGLLEAHKTQKLSLSNVMLLLGLLANFHASQLLEHVLQSLEQIVDLSTVKTHKDDILPTELPSAAPHAPGTSTDRDYGTKPALLTYEGALFLFHRATETCGLGCTLRRSLHGIEIDSEKRRTMTTILRAGSGPSIAEHHIGMFVRGALKRAILAGDNIALLTCVEVFNEQMDLSAILADQSVFNGFHALGMSIIQDAYENFVFLLDRYEFLADMSCTQGETNLNLAARMKSPQYTEHLLEHGADRYVRNDSGETPFLTALIRGPNIEVANLLGNNVCMDAVLGPCPAVDVTAFNRLLSLMVTWKRNISISALEYLVKNYGRPSIFFSQKTGITVFRYLLSNRTPYTDTDQLDKESNIFRYLAHLHKDEIDSVDPHGMAPLHYAASFANQDAVKTLLESQAKVDTLSTASTVEGSKGLVGYTPLALAILRKFNHPPPHLKEVTEDVKLWQQRIDEVINCLSRESDNIGPGADRATQMRALQASHPEMSNIMAVGILDQPPDIADRTTHAEWPRRLPRRVEPPGRYVEILGKDGLSRYEEADRFKLIQTLLGSIDSGIRSGNMVQPLGKAPQEYLEELQREWASFQHSNMGKRSQ